MTLKCLLFLVIVLAAGMAQAHHKEGHQNTDPVYDLYSWDCGKIRNYLEAKSSLFEIYKKYHRPIPKSDWKEYQKVYDIYIIECREV